VTTSFSDYLRLYRESWLKLQTTSPLLNSYQNRPLYTTWQVTFDQIQRQNPVSARLLELWAYFDKQDIWFELLRHGRSADDELIQKLTEDELSFNKAVRLLCEYGLVHIELSLRQSSRSQGYGMHSCVHSWTVYVLNGQWDDSLAKLALTCVASEVPDTNVDIWWLLQRRLLQHAARYKHWIMDGKVDIKGMEWALHRLGGLYARQGKVDDAEAIYTRALQGKEERLGPDHRSTLSTINNLGSLYVDHGKLADADAMYTRALRGYEQTLGCDHTSTLSTVHNLGNLYRCQGKLAEAEAMYTRALQGYEQTVGYDHIWTLLTANSLGGLLVKSGKLADAEAMCTRALQGYEQTLGPDHISALSTIGSLGNIYKCQGRLAEAEAMYTRALLGFEQALGRDHKWTLLTANNLRMLYKDKGELTEMEEM
jgi:tetratricopeptide (TPR) repeat protein